MINERNNKPKINEITHALNDFELTRKNIEQAIENLKNTHKNLQKTRNNFNQYKITKQTSYLNSVSRLGTATFEEKTKMLENLFVYCFFEDEVNEKIIIFDEKNNN